ncbi:hypothetical protein M422DRAFT_222162 [Sphaerobolus stellatus SS14]|nr:hypothetical protein M422DRAFT_222162 [Sphaerobolus stellatus SS14]
MAPEIPSDVQSFLENYPNQEDDPRLDANLKFYSNAIRCKPDNLFIEELHEQWQGDYDTLEFNHGFIQWLFPIQEFGMNYQSQPLQRHEIEEMKSDPQIIERILTSYRLMLEFYGFRLLDAETGLIDKVLPPRNALARFRHLNASFHNYLRITRILKCLSEMGLEHLNAGFLLGILNEQSENEQLNRAIFLSRGSMDRWWANCIRNENERNYLRERIREVRKGRSTLTRALYEEALQRRKETGSF